MMLIANNNDDKFMITLNLLVNDSNFTYEYNKVVDVIAMLNEKGKIKLEDVLAEKKAFQRFSDVAKNTYFFQLHKTEYDNIIYKFDTELDCKRKRVINAWSIYLMQGLIDIKKNNYGEEVSEIKKQMINNVVAKCIVTLSIPLLSKYINEYKKRK